MGYTNHKRVARRWRKWGVVTYWQHKETGRVWAQIILHKRLDDISRNTY
jgi:hypothetical protein